MHAKSDNYLSLKESVKELKIFKTIQLKSNYTHAYIQRVHYY